MQETNGAHALEYAGFWTRLAAFFIDAVIMSVVFRMLFPFRGAGLLDLEKYWYFIPLITISNLLSGLTAIAYSVVFWAWRGQTLGMMVLNIKVLRGNGSQMTFGYSLLRYLGYIICGMMLGTGFLWIIWDPRKQGIHDKIADTVVVKLPEPVRTNHAMATPRPS
jgi:uncharacterized RDD family membrane protein YckC